MDDLKFVLLDTSSNLVDEWNRAFVEHNPTRDNFTFLQSKLEDLPEQYHSFDCIVSPANSYGRLDGGFDYFLSQAISPSGDLGAPTKIVQKVLYSKWKGFAPPETCTLVPLKDTSCFPNPHSCRFIALCPTMHIPERVNWNKEIVYNCVWALLTEISTYNGSSQDKIHTVVMTGLATGVGSVPAERCAQQMALTIRDFYDALENPDKWSAMDWDSAITYALDCRRTHDQGDGGGILRS